MRFLLLTTCLSAAAHASDGTALGIAAEALQPGQWVQLNTLNVGPAIVDTGSSGHILTYSTEAEWNPGTRELLFVGGDHNGCEKFITYSAVTNAWTIEPRPSWLQSCTSQNHSYTYHAIDPVRGYYYYHSYAQGNVQRFDTASRTWTSFELPSSAYTARANWTQDFVVGRGLTLFANGGVWSLNETTRTWTELAPDGQYAQYENLHCMSEYSQVHGVAVFGGGDQSGVLFRLGANGAITRLRPAPVANLSQHPQGALVTVDPVGGDFLWYFAAGNRWYQHNPVTDVWSQLSQPGFPFANLGSTNNIVAAPVSTYGVVMFVEYSGPNQGRVWLYKHAASTAPLDTTPPAAPVLRIRPR